MNVPYPAAWASHKLGRPDSPSSSSDMVVGLAELRVLHISSPRRLANGSVRTVVVLTASLFFAGCASSPAREKPVGETFPVLTQCAVLPPTPDTVSRTVYATLETPLRRDTLPSAYAALVLDAIRQNFVLPRPLSLTVMGPADPTLPAAPNSAGKSPDRLTPIAFGELEMTLDRTGGAHDVHLTQSSLSPALDQAFLAAPTRADSAHAFPTLDAERGAGPLHLYIALQPDQPHAGRWAPFFNTRVPVWHYAHLAMPLSRSGQGWGNWNVGTRLADSVTLALVVDESGHAVPGTIRLVRGQYREFARAAAQSAEHARYYAGAVAGCAVKSLYTISYSYTVTR